MTTPNNRGKYVFVPCAKCGGEGVLNDWAFSQEAMVCPNCDGVGEIRVRLEDEDLALVATARKPKS